MEHDNRTNAILVLVISVLVVISALTYLVWSTHRGDIPQDTHVSQQTPPDNNQPSTDRDENGCFTPETVRNHYGENDCVDYKVGYVYETSAGTQFLDEKQDYQNGFVGYIPYNAEHLDIDSLEGKDIKVTGQIQEYNGYPEIVINQASQVRVYE